MWKTSSMGRWAGVGAIAVVAVIVVHVDGRCLGGYFVVKSSDTDC